MTEHAGVETLSGHLDFLQEVNEAEEWARNHLPHHDESLPEKIREGLPKDVTAVTTKDEKPANAHYRTFTLDGTEAQEITSPYPNRATLTVTCQAGGPARIGASNAIGTADGDPRSVRLAAGSSRTFTHTDKVYAHGPANTVVDVVEEHYA